MKMTKYLGSFLLATTLATTIVTTQSSCKDDDPVTPAQNITQIVSGNANFSLLNRAINRAGLAAALSSGTYTVFAPDNAAFTAAGINEAAIDATAPADLAVLLQYHVVAANVPSSGVPASDTVKTLLGINIYASKNANGVFVNGVKVKTADQTAANGVIHTIEAVLDVPDETIAEVVSGDPNFSLLLTAVSHGGLVGAVSGPGKYTVFAPTNAAFVNAGFPTAASITAAPSAAIAAVVLGHIIPTNVFASDLINASTAPTLQTGVSLLVGTTPPSVKVNGSANPVSNIDVAGGNFNIITTNGVIHVIDRVLLP